MLADISQYLDRIRPDSPIQEPPVQYQVSSIECGREEEWAHIIYEGDPQVYDSGKILTVVYRRNKNEPDAIENRIIDDSHLKENVLLDALDEVISGIPFFYPTVTRITLETVQGNLTVTSITEDEIISYLPIPPHLSHISTVPISELRKVRHLAMDVDRVKWDGQIFAFKMTGEDLEGTLRELTILDKLCNSPNIIDLKAIVVNPDNSVRGFLMPYMNSGDLDEFFVEVRRDLGVSEGDDVQPVIDRSLKLTWARQITQGVVDLHAIAAYNGDLKPQNVVLGPGRAILIDFLPMGYSDDFVAPEVLAKSDDHHTTLESVLTGPADIYSLGLVLFALVQEKARGVRVPLSWRDGSAPCWYRDVVQRCLHLDPAARPTAVEVLSLLYEGGSESRVTITHAST